MNDINSLPPVPQGVIDAMNREAEKKFGKVQGLEDQPIAKAQLHHTLQQYEEPQSIDLPENMEAHSEVSGENEESLVKQPYNVQNTREFEEQPQETEQVRNFRAIKEKAKQVERERDDALKLLKEYNERYQSQQSQVPEEVDTFGMNPDDLVEGKHLSKVAKEIKALKQQLAANQQQSYMANTEARLKTQFPDLDKVLTPDNIETFKYAYPELAATVDSTQDIYTKAVSAYTMIKKFGVYQEPGVNHEKEIAKKNAAKPRPLSSVSPQQGDSPISRANAFANGLTKELQEQMWKEMSQARKDY